MKIEISPLQIQIGQAKSGSFYKLIPIFQEEVKEELGKKFPIQIETKVFSGELGKEFRDEAEHTIYLGLGEKEKLNFRKLISHFFKYGEKILNYDGMGLEIHIPKALSKKFSADRIAYQIANTLFIGSYPVSVLQTKKKDKEKKKVGSVYLKFEDKSVTTLAEAGLSKSKVVAKHVNGARHIAHLPANYFTPNDFVSRAKEIAKEYKLSVKVWEEAQLKKEGLGGILAVSRGSELEGKMVILEYKPTKAKKKFAIVGKGLTFDTGGISLKPPGEMHEMKYDMCGAAATIHAIGAIAALEIPIHIIAAIGVAENMPDGKAIKPGDVYTAYNGTTVEVQNTDAEGRLVLGDVLSYVSKNYKPDYMVDLATLTGAVIIALGHEAAAILTNSDPLREALFKASEASDDRVWELPLWDEYGEDLKSDIADLKNITGGGKGAGTISAGIFLSKFVDDSINWAHIDIAGAAWRKKKSGTQFHGPTGYGVRLLVDLAKELAGK
ncbi:Leucyl aminopeptidase [Leptospira biflexa serovar Patoc strain 'Patoc 1 (Ames)']|uniref:Probable cytosol aminopeptidase n=1 Tax=Leptospira biflexa serovar Patoc (strain Patoc 1 / ATCC 23582 / Paris) TaxID=456481 RepID=B0SJN3_LEPBP|nr:leucyl aminopeptidase [Leptospira biflexa]ABZ92974.1 Leucyl aminopeptidase [Leptospira biflexa serovar Patoc strain 'Patoc 1 (Ames)']ABZ96589.1 Aminopeptidase, M17 family [Leptospira biflexa serovar Patoc strain 'Patoc 1 (Paris)']